MANWLLIGMKVNCRQPLSGYGFKFCCCHLNFRYGACFEQGVPGHSGKLQSVDWI